MALACSWDEEWDEGLEARFVLGMDFRSWDGRSLLVVPFK